MAEDWKGVWRILAGAGEYKITAMLTLPCPRFIPTLVVLQPYMMGVTYVLLADLSCWQLGMPFNSVLVDVLGQSSVQDWILLLGSSRDSKLSSLETWAQDVDRDISITFFFLLTHMCCLSPWTLLSSGLWVLLFVCISYYCDPIAVFAISVKHIQSKRRSGWVKWQFKSKGRAGKMARLPCTLYHTT